MYSISIPATKVLIKITNNLNDENRSIDINNSDSVYQPVHAEYLHSTQDGDYYSVCHSYIQNGDIMRDPEVVFLRKKNYINDSFNFFPVSFQQDNLGIYREFFTYNENGTLKTIYRAPQKDCTSFCNMWMKNIKIQQNF